MKTLAVCIVLIFISVALPPGGNQQQKPTDSKNDVAAPQQPPPPISIVNNQNCPTQEQAPTPTKPCQNPEKSFWGDAPTWGLLVVGLIAAYIALGTLNDIRKQTKIAWDAATAAFLNAQAVINSEQPWLTISLQEIPYAGGNSDLPNLFAFRATNKGRTPAKIISGTLDHVFANNMDALPQEPAYLSYFTYPYQSFLTQDEHFDIHPPFMPTAIINSRAIGDRMFNPNQILFFYGRIIYDDVLGKNRPGGARHETRWCFAYDVAARFVRTGSAKYDDYT